MKIHSQRLFEAPLVGEASQFTNDTANLNFYNHEEVQEELEIEFFSLKKAVQGAAKKALIPIAIGLSSLPGGGGEAGRALTQLLTGTSDERKGKDQANDNKPDNKPVKGGSPPKKESELELEAELSFLHNVSPNVLMEFLASNASEAESEAEAAYLIKSLLPFILRQHPNISRFLSNVSPKIARALIVSVQALYRDPNTRPLIRILPTVLRLTIAKLNQRLTQGRTVTPEVALQIFKHEINLILSKPEYSIRVLRRSNTLLEQTAASYNNQSRNLESYSQWLFELPFSSLTNTHANFYPNQGNYIYPELEFETPDPAVTGLCTTAKSLANKLRSEIESIRNKSTIKNPQHRESAIQRVRDKGKEWINRQVRNSFAIIDRLHPRDLDLLYGCLAQVSIAISFETEPLRRLRGKIQKRLAGKGI